MLDPNKINLQDTYMRSILAINAQTMAIFQIFIDKGICKEAELEQYTEEAIQSINENIKRNMEVLNRV